MLHLIRKSVIINKYSEYFDQKVNLFWVNILFKLIFTALTGFSLLYLSRIGAIGGMLVWIIWFLILCLIAMPQSLNTNIRWNKVFSVFSKLSFIILTIILAISVAFVVSFESGLLKPEKFSPSIAEFLKTLKSQYHYSDGTALIEQATYNLLDGKNPYASSNTITAIKEFNGSYQTITPLRDGSFSDLFPYPSSNQLQQLWNKSLITPNEVPAEIESNLGYPAGSFLLLVPFSLLGINDLHWVLLIFFAATLFFSVLFIPQKSRGIFCLAIIFSLELWYSCLIGADKRMLIFPFLLIGWLLLTQKPILSTILLGIAAASFQIAWFMLPFALILIYRHWGLRQALWCIAVVVSVFLVFNLPFMILDYHAWQTSVISPMADKLFPMGIGPVSLTVTGIINLRSSIWFTIIEIVILFAGILWYFSNARKYPNYGILLSFLPLFFAWRSISFYFYYIDIILLVVILTQNKGSTEVKSNS